MLTSDLVITTKTVDSKADHIIVSQGCRILERVSINHQLYWKRPIRVVKIDDWISIKWSTRHGATQFQVKLLSVNDCEQIVKCLEDAGIAVAQKSTREEHSTGFTKDSDETLCNPYMAGLSAQYNQSQTQLNTQLNEKPLFQIQSTPLSQVHSSQTKYSPTQTSQLAGIKLKLRQSNPSNLVEVDTVDPQLASDDKVGNSLEILSLAEKVSVFSEACTITTNKRQGIRSPNIPDMIKNKIPINLSVDSYSFMESRNPKAKGIWRHVALTSDLCLSLVPNDYNDHPIVLFTRGLQVIEHFVPHPGYLRAFYTQGIITFQQFSPNRMHERLVEIHMKNANIVATCEWLRSWMVGVEDVMRANMVDPSTGGLSSMIPESDSSNISRESRWWSRRTTKFHRKV